MNKTLTIIFNYLFTLQRLILFFFTVILGSTILLLLLFQRNNLAFHNTNFWVLHTHKVIEQAAQVSAFTKDVQWESRTYILSGDKNSLDLYYNSRSNLLASITGLSKLTTDNSLQQARIKKLQAHVNSLIAFTDRTVQSNTVKKNSLDDYIKNRLNQNVFYIALNKQIGEIINEEKGLLAIREAVNNKNINANYNIFIGLGLLIFFILAFAFASISYNLRKRKKAEKKTAESERSFQMLVNSIKDLAIFTTDAQGVILNWYAGASNIKGYEAGEVVGKNISIFYTPEAIKNGEPQQNLLSAAANGSFETQGWRVRKDGSVFWADVLIATIYDPNGKVQGFTKVTRDFSLHKKAQDEIRDTLEKEKELNEMKSNFVSTASHEFRTPLSAILSSVILLERYGADETNDRRNKHIQRIRSSVNEMVHMLDEFLSLEKIEKGKVEPAYETFNLQQLARHVCDKFNTSEIQGRIFEIHHVGAQEVYLDKEIVDHILTNLVSNAVKYSPNETKIIVETRVTERTIELMVKDYGIGISPADQTRLFGRFFRVSNTGNIKGTGLGLHITKKYIDLMKGTISVQSEIDKGSTFTVVFPYSHS